MSKRLDERIYFESVIEDLRRNLGEAHNDNASQRKDIAALRRGVITSYEVTTINPRGTRNVREFTSKVDALHWAAAKRTGTTEYDLVTIIEKETRRQGLYSDGRVISPFAN